MSSRSALSWIACSAVGVVVLLGGCDASGDVETDASMTSGHGVQPDVPAGFDPCTDIPQSVFASENLKSPRPQNSDASGGIKWRGCTWIPSNGGYGANIQTTNITVAMVSAKNFADSREFSIGGRAAISGRQIPERLEYSCTVNVEMREGSLQISITNPPTSNMVDQDTCEIARRLAERIAPSLPASN
ncbi:DUF3558 domain-containing protein [Nocardia shimofusensis]|uniref:DUF3558 domain-containing protein n=1 Tax=Nocardia shimofusensis TaxID=228596 RepID=UPI000A0436D0|nr:DUF3558 domain-containing protein [Nocardia shimofusensis]